MQRADSLGVTTDLLAVLAAGQGLGLLALPQNIAATAQAAVRRDFDLRFLLDYAIECPLVECSERWLAVRTAPTLRVKAQRLWTALFPKYTHLWASELEAQAAKRSANVYCLAWSRRATRLLHSLLNTPKFARNLRATARAYQMFGDQRGSSLLDFWRSAGRFSCHAFSLAPLLLTPARL